MRTLIFIAAGIALWSGLTAISALRGHRVSWKPTIAFACIWLVVAGWNMWTGVTQAGYGVMEELPIFALIYLAPIALAIAIVAYRLRRL